jgi:hypothetical protein
MQSISGQPLRLMSRMCGDISNASRYHVLFIPAALEFDFSQRLSLYFRIVYRRIFFFIHLCYHRPRLSAETYQITKNKPTHYRL